MNDGIMSSDGNRSSCMIGDNYLLNVFTD